MATSPKRIETLVGFFLFVGVALLGILIMQFGRFADRFRGREGFEGRFGDRCQARGQIYSEFACGCARAHVDESGVEAASRNARLICRRLLTVSASSRSRRYKRVSVGGT